MIYKAMFDAHRERANLYGRAVFVEADTIEDARAAVPAAAEADYPGHRIDVYAVGESTVAARDAFLAWKEKVRKWHENNRAGVPNQRGEL